MNVEPQRSRPTAEAVSESLTPEQTLPLSAGTPAELRRYAGAVARRLDRLMGARPAAAVLADAAYTLQVGRSPLACRTAVATAEPAAAIAALRAVADGHHGGGAVLAPVQAAAAAVPGPAPATFAAAVRAWLDGAGTDWASWWPAPRTRLSLPAPARWTRDTAEERGSGEPVRIAAAEASQARADELAAYLTGLWAGESGIAAGSFGARTPLDQIGLSSFLVTRVNARLRADLGEEDRTLFFSHRDLAGVARTLAGRHPARETVPAGETLRPAETPRPAETLRSAETLRPAETPPAQVTTQPHPGPPAGRDDRIAIIGMAGRLPGARTLAEYWANLASGRDCVTPVPAGRTRPGWPADLMWGGFLDGVENFDPLLFSITPRDAELMDPQERQFLEVAWECLEDAGYPPARLAARHRGQAGVFVGAMHNEYPYFGIENSLGGAPQDAGATLAGIANRVSFFLDLHGISLSVDTMCSSSLTAIHLARQSLSRGETELAIVGGVNLSLHRNKFVQQQRMHLAASDHRCRSFGAGGDGFVPAEAVVALLLKPLAAALADGDRVHAVLAGSAVVHAGRTNGYLVPNPVAQGDMIARAWRDAGLDPAGVGYLEAHGAGTALGDPVEIDGLLRAFGPAGLAPGSVPIGSVKSSIGHAEAAAGLAGLVKVVLQMRHGELVPSLHAAELNPGVPWDTVPFRVQREHAAWPRADGRPRLAGISSFGAGGAIAHVVVEEFAGPRPAPAPDGGQLVLLSGRDEQALRRSAGRLLTVLREESRSPDGRGPDLAAIAYTSQVGREPLRERLAVLTGTVADLVGSLEAYLAGDARDTVLRGSADRLAGPPARQWAPGADLADLARAWASGQPVDWEANGTRPPGLITDLPHYPFEELRCWLPEPAAPAGPGQAGQTRTAAAAAVPPVPLFEHGWMADGPVAAPGRSAGRVICLFSPHTEAVAAALREYLGDAAVLVCEGEVRSGGHGYVSADEAIRFAGQLRVDGVPVQGWIDLADLYRPAAEAGLWQARLAALRALISGGGGRGLRVLHAQADGADGRNQAAAASAAVVAGVVRALAAEGTVAAARTVELDVPPEEAARCAAQLLGEWRTDSAYPRVRHAGGLRYRPALLPAGPPDRTFAPRPEASYLVTGGTRGIGARVARWLVDGGARQIALIGRTELDGEQWSAVRELTAAGARVLVHVGSLADRSAVGAFLTRVRGELGPVDGIVHCAGTSGRAASFAAKDFAAGGAASAVLEPKVEGFEVLRDLTAGDHPSFAVLFSSICAVAPSLARGVSDYAAANTCLEAAARAGVQFGDCPVQSVAWPQWAESGQAAGEGNVCAPLGIDPLTDQQGLGVLAAVIARPRLRSAVPLPATRSLDLDAIPAVTTVQAVLPLTVPPEPAAPPRTAGPGGTGETTSRSVPAWLCEVFAAALHLPAARLDPDADFGDLGVESILLGELLQAIEERAGRSLNPGLLLDHPTLRQLAAALERELGSGLEAAGPPAAALERELGSGLEAAGPPAAAPAAPAGPAAAATDAAGRVAIIGAACRFPGAPDLDTFWRNLLSGQSAVREVPPSRWDHRAHYRPEPETGFSVSKWGGFVDGIEEFDPDAFGMDDEEARALDPAIRLTLETTRTCLADAGYQPEEVAGRPAGVFVGARMSRYGDRVPTRAAVLRSDQNFIAAYVAQHFDLRGPNLVVDSACSSSLVSLQLAMRSLLDGECEVAVAGGVEILLDERDYIDLSAAGALSRAGRCATFDESADGFVPGEGCGLLLLKPLAAALADGDRVRAVIEAVAVNNDGRTMGVTTPSREGQERVVRQALSRAGRRPAEVGLIEAHGTGTLIGDPIELRALSNVFGGPAALAPSAAQWCPVGSVKTNIGHLLSAAGVAGVLKAMLAIEHGIIPAMVGCERPNPRFSFERSPFFPSTSARQWEAEPGHRVAGVSSFGLGGTNAHAVLSGLPGPARVRPAARSPLPPPAFRRRRLWYEPAAEADPRPPERPGGPDLPGPSQPRAVASLLDLQLVGGLR